MAMNSYLWTICQRSFHSSWCLAIKYIGQKKKEVLHVLRCEVGFLGTWAQCPSTWTRVSDLLFLRFCLYIDSLDSDSVCSSSSYVLLFWLTRTLVVSIEYIVLARLFCLFTTWNWTAVDEVITLVSYHNSNVSLHALYCIAEYIWIQNECQCWV